MAQRKHKLAPVSKSALFAQLKERRGGIATLTSYEVPEWNCIIYLAELSGWDQEKIQKWTGGKDVKFSDAAKMLSLVCRDEVGAHLFTEEQVEILLGESGVLLTRIMTFAASLNGVDVEEEKKS